MIPMRKGRRPFIFFEASYINFLFSPETRLLNVLTREVTGQRMYMY